MLGGRKDRTVYARFKTLWENVAILFHLVLYRQIKTVVPFSRKVKDSWKSNGMNHQEDDQIKDGSREKKKPPNDKCNHWWEGSRKRSLNSVVHRRVSVTWSALLQQGTEDRASVWTGWEDMETGNIRWEQLQEWRQTVHCQRQLFAIPISRVFYLST